MNRLRLILLAGTVLPAVALAAPSFAQTRGDIVVAQRADDAIGGGGGGEGKRERPDRAERPEKAERPERAERPDRQEQPQRAERPDRIERPDRAEKPDRMERPDRTERPTRDAAEPASPREQIKRDRQDAQPDRATQPDRAKTRDSVAPERPSTTTSDEKPSLRDRMKEREGPAPGAERPDAVKPDASRRDAGKPETGKPDAVTPNAGAPDAKPSLRERMKDRDATKPDAVRPDATRPDASRPDAAKPDASRPDAKPNAIPPASERRNSSPGVNPVDGSLRGSPDSTRDRAQDPSNRRDGDDRSNGDRTRDGDRRDGDRARDGDRTRDNNDRDRDGDRFRDGRDPDRRDRDADRRDRNDDGPLLSRDERRDRFEQRMRDDRRDSADDRRRRDDDRIDVIRGERRERRDGDTTIITEGDRTIYREGDRTFIRRDENLRFRDGARDIREDRDGDYRRTVIVRPDGSEIVTLTDDDGRLVSRTRRYRGEEYVLIDNRPRGGDRRPGVFIDLGLAPPRVSIPREEYIVDADDASYEQIEEAFAAPPVERIERSYTLDEIRQNAPLRERVRSVDLDTVTFDTGSWDVRDDQIKKLENVGLAMESAIKKNPRTVFMVEGYTDAVGNADDNLSLSDRRAQAVAEILTKYFTIPAENLTTQGYGEQYLKVRTDGPEERNRRVTVRNITQLLSSKN